MCPIFDGQAVNAANSNAAWLDAQTDDTAVGKISLANSDALSGTAISNIQRELNADAYYMGKAVNLPITALPTWVDINAGSASDDLTERSEALTVKFNPSTGHTHDGTTGEGPVISAASIGGVPLHGYFVKGIDQPAVTGSFVDITSSMFGKTPSSGASVAGVVVTFPENKAFIRQASGSGEDDIFIDAYGHVVYGRVNYAVGTWLLDFFVESSGVEDAYSFVSAYDVRWYYQELFNPLVAPPTYDELASIFPSKATASSGGGGGTSSDVEYIGMTVTGSPSVWTLNSSITPGTTPLIFIDGANQIPTTDFTYDSGTNEVTFATTPSSGQTPYAFALTVVPPPVSSGGFIVYGTHASGIVVTGTVGVVSTTDQRALIFVVSNGGVVPITMSPQVSAGTTVGQELRLVGTSDTDYITMADGNGLSLNGMVLIKQNVVIDLFWNGLVWVESSRA